MSQANTVTVHILDKEYQVACPENQESELASSAKYLDKQMRSIRDTGKVIGLERIAVMAALNISFELLQASTQSNSAQGSNGALKQLNSKLDDALYDLRQLEIG
ncbi:MAG: cell division protein ZapA [Halioglobus sp.]